MDKLVVRHARRRVLVVAVLSLAAILMPLPAVAGQQVAAVPDQVSDEASALRIARAGNKPVRVLSQTDESNEVIANPDGRITWTQHVRPVRVKQGDDWIPVDTTLVRRPDGTVAPKAASVDLALSGGGDKSPIVKVGRNGIEVGLGWSRPLPEPRLDGPTATYSDVLPDVDLKVTADVTGFGQVLVVKTPAAAKNPELRRVAFGSYGKGAKVKLVDGQLQTGENGPVFKGDASRMWDSSGTGSERDRLTGNVEGVRTATMGVEVSDTAVSIKPDQAFLIAPETKFPVYLDPSYGCTDCGKAHHAVVQSYKEWQDEKNYDRTDGKLNDLKAGYACDGPCFVSRTYVGMKTYRVIDKVVHSAYLHLDVDHSAYCAGSEPTEVWSTDLFGPTTTWNNHPLVRSYQSSGSACSGQGMDLDVVQAVRDGGVRREEQTSFLLQGKVETNTRSWRRFKLNPYLVVQYNGAPDTPYDMGIEGWGDPVWAAKPCVVGPDRPVVGTRSPRLRARANDPESREFGGLLNITFDVTRGPWNKPTGDILRLAQDNIPAGSYGEATATLPGDGIYNWHAITGDYELLSHWSNHCELEIDTIAPFQPEVSSAEYPKERDSGGIGQPGSFTFKPHWKSGDTAYYLYSFTEKGGNDPVIEARPDRFNGPATVQWTPTLSGPQVLSVRAVDRAGNMSDIVRYRVDVSDYQVGVSGKVARWAFDDSIQDVSEAKSLIYNGPRSPSGSFVDGPQGRAAAVKADYDEYYQVKDSLIRTDKSFTVSAWVNLATDDKDATVLSQDGARASGFKLLYDKQSNRWALSFDARDDDSTTVAVKVKSTQPPTLNTWTHLTGVYDADAVNKKVRLYVNGQQAGDADVPTSPWNSTGPFAVGAAKVKGERTQHFTGGVDSVRAHSRTLTSAEVAALHAGTSNVAPVGEYLFENTLGNSGANNNLSVATPEYDTGFGGKALKLGASSAPRPVTAAAVVDHAAAFSVASWVKLADKANRYTVASQDTDSGSGLLVQYASDVDRWVFGLAAADGSIQWVRGTSAPVAGQWVHVTAVHDTTAHKIFLYVNGVREAEAAVTSVNTTSKAFVVGAARAQNARTDLMNGLVDEVNVYDGALNDAEIVQLVNSPIERARYQLDETTGRTAANSVGGAPANLYGGGVTWGNSGGSAAAKFDGVYPGHMGTVEGAGPLARWTFDNTTNDSSGNGRDLVHRNASGDAPATYAQGRHGPAVSLNGANQYLQRPDLTVNTSASFSISAWASIDNTTKQAVIVSQDGTRSTPFRLMYAKSQDRWAFSTSNVDQPLTATANAYSKLSPTHGSLTHLLGVYDAPAHKVRLYVNGYLEDETEVSKTWKATGPFTVGRAKSNDNQTDYFTGLVDEVRVYDRALADADAHSLWNLGSNVVAPLGASLRADGSFTLAGWVRPDEYGNLASQAFSFGTMLRSTPLTVGYVPEHKRWGATVDVSAGPDRVGKQILSDSEARTYADTTGWVHLAVTYDAVARKVGLYINGVPQSSFAVDGRVSKVDPANPPPGYAGANTTIVTQGRDLLIGRTTWDGQTTGYWKGSIRDVRAFTGVVPEICRRDLPTCLSQLPYR